MDKNAQWITNRLMCNLSVFNVFHKEVKNEKKMYDGKLINVHVLFRNKFYICICKSIIDNENIIFVRS